MALSWVLQEGPGARPSRNLVRLATMHSAPPKTVHTLVTTYCKTEVNSIFSKVMVNFVLYFVNIRFFELAQY